MAYTLYKLTCTVTGKSYVGYTSRTLTWRWKRHLHGALVDRKKSIKQLLAIAIRKHGVDVWLHEVLEVVEIKDEALTAEKRLIEEHKTYFRDHPDTGYNMTPGGDWGMGHPKGVKLTLQHRERIGNSCRGLKRPLDAIQRTAEAHRGMKRSEETREKIKVSRANQTFSEETRRKMSEVRKGRKVPLEQLARRPKRRSCKKCGQLGHYARSCKNDQHTILVTEDGHDVLTA